MDKVAIWNAVGNIDKSKNVCTFMVLCHKDIEEQRQVLSVLNSAGFILDEYAMSILDGEDKYEFFNPIISRINWTRVACANDGYRSADLVITFREFMKMFGHCIKKELEPIDEKEFEIALNEMIYGV